MAIKASGQITISEIYEEYWVILSNEAHVFRANASNTAIAGNTSIKIYGYQGDTQISTKVGTISGLPSAGMTATISNNNTKNTTITIAVTTALTSSIANNGILTIPITIGTKTINKTFSWSKAQQGAAGTSITIKESSITYQTSSSATEAPTGTWTTTIPETDTVNKYLWVKTTVTYSDGTTTTTYSISSTMDSIQVGGRNLLKNTESITLTARDTGEDSDNFNFHLYEWTETPKASQQYTVSG